MFGCAIELRMRCRNVISTGISVAAAVCNVAVRPSNLVTTRPSSFFKRSSRLVAIKSISGGVARIASSSVKALLCNTAWSASCAFLPRLPAIVRT